MLTKRDVENILDKVDGETWEYWRDSGNYHCWFLGGGDWLLQVSHTQNTVAINDQRADHGYTMATAGYGDDRVAVAFVAGAAKDPVEAHESLSDLPQSTVVDAEVKWVEEGGGSGC